MNTTTKLQKKGLIPIEVRKAANVLRALNHPLRQEILELIKAGDNRCNVTTLYSMLRIEQSVASQHLAILREAKLVTTQKVGKYIVYSVDEMAILRVIELSDQLTKLNYKVSPPLKKDLQPAY